MDIQEKAPFFPQTARIVEMVLSFRKAWQANSLS
jgi:hypothetical protein